MNEKLLEDCFGSKSMLSEIMKNYKENVNPQEIVKKDNDNAIFHRELLMFALLGFQINEKQKNDRIPMADKFMKKILNET